MIYPEYVAVVMTERHREAEQARLVRQVKQANKATKEGKPRRRRFVRLRDPLKA